jgi:hypothetical protein
MLQMTVSWPVFLGVKPHHGPKTRLWLLSESCGLVHVGRPLWQEDGSIVYICCWPLPVQSFSGLGPRGFYHILLSQIWDYPNLGDQVPIFISPRNRVVHLYPQALGLLFLQMLMATYYAASGWTKFKTLCSELLGFWTSSIIQYSRN